MIFARKLEKSAKSLTSIPFGEPIADLELRWSDRYIKNWTFPWKLLFRYTIGPRKKYVPLDMLTMCRFHFGLSRNDCTKDKKWPKKSAAFGGRLLVLFWGLEHSHFLKVQNQIYTYWAYLMEHIFFGVQLCINISIFKEKLAFCYSDHPEITPGLLLVVSLS